MASDADPDDSGKSSGHRLSLQARLALLGIAGALLGTLTGGLVTWLVTRDQLAAQRADTRRAERLNAYSTYYGDTAQFWTKVFDLYAVTPRPKRLQESDKAALRTLKESLTRDFALVSMLAPDRVSRVAGKLYVADIQVGNALESDPIVPGLYERSAKQVNGGRTPLLKQFVRAARRDLHTKGR